MDISKARSLIDPIVKEMGCELLEVRSLTEYGRNILRVLVDKDGGVAVGDCEKISREIDTLLEVEGVAGSGYLLEVSSPGLDRPLVKESDFVRFAGKMVSLKTREAIEGRRNYKGLLKGVEASQIVMVIDGKEYRVPVELVERAHLVY